MKKFILRLYVVSLLLALVTVSCTKDFDEINTDPNKPPKFSTPYLLTSFQEFMTDNYYDEWFGGRFSYIYAQYWSQMSYTDESRYLNRENTINSWWNYCYAGRDIDPPDGAYNGGGIIDLIEIIRLNTDEETRDDAALLGGANVNQIAVARILKAFSLQIMTDTWGDIPYTEAFQGAENPLPVYTSQSVIYGDLLNELDEAQQQIDETAAAVSGDIIYGGDMAKWKKFANSLRLRVAMRMSKVPAGSLPSGVSSINAVINDAVADGVFESNADNAVLKYLGLVPNNHPLNENAKTRSDFAISEPFVALLNSYADPRVNFYGALPADTSIHEVTGFPYGLTRIGATALNDNTFSRVDGTGPDPTGNFSGVYAPDAPAVLMDYAEVCFILSEANNYDQTEYENGITASCEFWGVDEADITTYLASVPAALAQTVAEQKYIALYVQNNQGWCEWRRTGYPVLGLPEGGIMEPGLTEIPRRMYYPFDEETNNTANWSAACQAQGWGDTDLLDDRVWWDVE